VRPISPGAKQLQLHGPEVLLLLMNLPSGLEVTLEVEVLVAFTC
jgi:hypothetical protein